MNNEAIKKEIARLENTTPEDKFDAHFIAKRLESLKNQLAGVVSEQSDWIENEI